MVRAFVLFALLVAGPARAEDVASVMAVTGAVVVVDGGGETTATVGQGLSRDDVVRTDFGGAVILHLHNNHLVRIDEDLELRVSELVLLDAPPVTLDAKAQLAQLVQPGERSAMAGLAEAERVAGWHARLTAAYTPGAEDDAEAAPAREEAVATRSAPSAGPSRARGPKKESSSLAPPPPPAPDVGTAASGSAAAAVAPSADAPKERETKADAKSAIAQTRAELEAAFARGPLHDAIVAWARDLPVQIGSVTFDVRVSDGRISKIVAHGGLLPPAELRALVGTTVTDATEAFTVTVAVK